MSRIYKERASINSEKTLEFFEKRGKNVNAEHPLTSILYQDGNPGLAEERDAFEKSEAVPLMKLTNSDDVLDVGCGIGRWVADVANQVHSYHGVDFSQNLIDVAAQRTHEANVSFQCLASEDVDLSRLDSATDFSRVIVAGLLIYLNDRALAKTLSGIASCCRQDSLLYVREPVAVAERLTLKEFWSGELDSEYSAIYRTRDELEELFNETLYAAGFQLALAKPLYPDHLNNRVETQQFVFVFERS